MDLSQIHDQFPAPSYRGVQQQALEEIADAFGRDKSIVLVQAPTGSGKSLLARAVAGCAKPHTSAQGSTGAYYTTPQVSQIDEVASDEFLDDISLIKGKSNYECIRDMEHGKPVTQARCSRDPNFDCPVIHDCPYFSDRSDAIDGGIAGMTLAYFLETAPLNIFEERDILIVDEAHGLPEWAEMHATIEISANTIPNWSKEQPTQPVTTIEDAWTYLLTLIHKLEHWQTELKGQSSLDGDEAWIRDHLQGLIPDIRWFLDSFESDSVRWLFEPTRGEGPAFKIKPLRPGRFLDSILWDRGQHILLLSATLLDKNGFCRSVGLNANEAAFITLDHTFPVENRSLYDAVQGKMTHEQKEETIPNVAQTISHIMDHHESTKGLIHCHSYAIQQSLLKRVRELQGDGRLRDHTGSNRDRQLKLWKQSISNEVFFSVKMEEALDLEGDLCRWQVLCKAPYPNTQDPAVENRLGNDQWGWYYRTTVRTLIQASGRIVRTPNDYGETYIVDESILDVFQKARSYIPDWYQAQIDQITSPSFLSSSSPIV